MQIQIKNRVIALFVCTVFTLTSLTDLSLAAFDGRAVSPTVFRFSQSVLNIPTQYGQVTENVYGDPDAPAFIHIQSAHGHYEAEKNIESILSFINKKSNIRLMLLEGATSKLQPNLFRIFPDHPKFNRKVTDRLIQEGYLTGPESFLIESPHSKIEGWGIENLEAYKKDRDAFIDVISRNRAAEIFLLKLQADLDKHFIEKQNKNLLSLVRQEECFVSGTMPLEAWLRVLGEASKRHLKLDLSDAFYQDQYPFLIRYFRLQEIDSKVNHDKARLEAGAFIKELEKRRVPSEVIGDFQSILGTVFSENLAEGARHVPVNGYSPMRLLFERAFTNLPHNFSMDAWPDWMLFAQQIILMQEVKGKGLDEEMVRLKEKILETLAKTPAEKEYIARFRQLYLMKRLLKLELTRTEYEKLILEYRSIVDKQREDSEIKILLKAAFNFYTIAIDRENKMFANALKKMGEMKQQSAVIVTGGFHAAGLKKLAVEKHCSYLQITPRITEISKYDRAVYHHSILGGRDIETSQMSALLGTVDSAERVDVTGRHQAGSWFYSIRGIILDVLHSEGEYLRSALTRAFSESVFSSSKLSQRMSASSQTRSEARVTPAIRAVINEKLQFLADYLATREEYVPQSHVGMESWSSTVLDTLDFGSTRKILVMIFGSWDKKTAEESARRIKELQSRGIEVTVLTSGKYGGNKAAVIHDAEGRRLPEAEWYKNILENQGVAVKYLEAESTNSGENIRFSKAKLDADGYNPDTIILMQTPLLQRRAGLSVVRQFLGSKEAFDASNIRLISYAPYVPDISKMSDEDALRWLSYALQEITSLETYPEKGYTIPAIIPSTVRDVHHELTEIKEHATAMNSMQNMDIFFAKLAKKTANMARDQIVTIKLHVLESEGNIAGETITLPAVEFESLHEQVVFYLALLIHRRGLLLGASAVALDVDAPDGKDAGLRLEMLQQAKELISSQYGATEMTASFGKGIRIEKSAESLAALTGSKAAGTANYQATDFSKGESIGVDFGGTNLKISVIRGGEILTEKKIPLESVKDRAVGEVIEQEIRSIASMYGESLLQQPVYVTIPGMVSPDGKILKITNVEKNQPRAIESLEALQSRVDLDIHFIVDASAASFLQKAQLHLAGNIIVNTLGTGLGLGILINGKLISGPQSAHLRTYIDSDYTGTAPVYHSGFSMSGDLESYANKEFVNRRSIELAKEAGVEIPISVSDLSPEVIAGWIALEEARPLRKIAAQVFEELGNHLALLYNEIARLTGIYEWTVILVGGIASGKAVELIQKGIMEKAAPDLHLSLKIGSDPAWAGSRGAAYLGIEKAGLMNRVPKADSHLIKLLVLDLDGTLYSLNELKHVYRNAMYELYRSRHGGSFDQARDIVEQKRRELQKQDKPFSDQNTIEALGFTYREKTDNEAKLIHINLFKNYAGLREVLEQLKKKYTLVLATNNTHQRALSILRHIGLDGIFENEAIHAQNVTKIQKPDTRIFDRLQKKYDLQSSQVLSIGDRDRTDLVPARQLGMNTVLVRGPEELTKHLTAKISRLEMELGNRDGASSLSVRSEIRASAELSKLMENWRKKLESVRNDLISQWIVFRYAYRGVSFFQSQSQESASRRSREDVQRARGLLKKLSNVVLIQSQEGEGETAVSDLADYLFQQKGVQRILKINLKEFQRNHGEQSEKELKDIFLLIQKAHDRVGLIFTSMEESVNLRSAFNQLVRDSNVAFLGLTDMKGYRRLDAEPLLASGLNFVLTEKTPRGLKRDQSVLIIGATSFLGKSLYTRFKAAYQEVRGTGFTKTGSPGIDKLDVTSEKDVERYFKDHPSMDTVIYVAGEASADVSETDPARAQRLNAEAVERISRHFHGKFVYISTEYVFDGDHPPYGAFSQAQPVNIYGHSKLSGERIAHEKFESSIALRIGALYGYNDRDDKATSFAAMAQKLVQGKPVQVDNHQVKRPILIDDVALSLIKLLDHEGKGIFQLNGAEGFTKYEMAQIIASVVSRDLGHKSVFPLVGSYQPGPSPRPQDTHMINIDTPRLFEEGARETILQSGVLGLAETERSRMKTMGGSSDFEPVLSIQLKNLNPNIFRDPENEVIVSIGALPGYRDMHGSATEFPNVYLLPELNVQNGHSMAALEEAVRRNMELSRGTVIMGSSDQIKQAQTYLEESFKIDWSQSGLEAKEQGQLAAESEGLTRLLGLGQYRAWTEFVPINIGKHVSVGSLTVQKLPEGKYKVGSAEVDSRKLLPLEVSTATKSVEIPDFGITSLDRTSFILWVGSRGILVNATAASIPLIEALNIPLARITDVLLTRASENATVGLIPFLERQRQNQQKVKIITAQLIWNTWQARLTALLGSEKARDLLSVAVPVLVKVDESFKLGDAAFLSIQFAFTPTPTLMGSVSYGGSQIVFSSGHVFDHLIYEALNEEKIIDRSRQKMFSNIFWRGDSDLIVLEPAQPSARAFESFPPANKTVPLRSEMRQKLSGPGMFQSSFAGETIAVKPRNLGSRKLFADAQSAIQGNRAVIGWNYREGKPGYSLVDVAAMTGADVEHLPEEGTNDFRELVERGKRISFAFGFSAGGMSERSDGQLRAAGEPIQIEGIDPQARHTFFEWKLAVARAAGFHFSVLGMTSFVTEQRVRQLLRANNHYGFDASRVVVFNQSFQRLLVPPPRMLEKYLTDREKQLRLEVSHGIFNQTDMDAQMEAYRRGFDRLWNHAGEPLMRSDGSEVLSPSGHLDFIMELVASGELARLRARGVKFIYHSNVNNLAAVIDDRFYALTAYFQDQIDQTAENEKKPVLMAEVTENRGDFGSYPAWVTDSKGNQEKRFLPVEALTSQNGIKDFPLVNTANYFFSVEGLWNLFEGNMPVGERSLNPTESIPYRLFPMEIREMIDGRQTISVGLRIDQMLDDLVAVVPSLMIEVPRDARFVPVKRWDDVERSQGLLTNALRGHVDTSIHHERAHISPEDHRRLTLQPILFEPDNFAPYMWGGTGIREFKGDGRAGDIAAESWEVSAHPKYPSRVSLSSGQVVTLSTLLANVALAEGILGKRVVESFGSRMALISKFLDVHKILSIQVHPSDTVAKSLGETDPGKEEDFVVLSTHDHGENIFYLGLQDGVTQEQFAKTARAGDDLRPLLNKVHVKAGDVIRVPPGVPHAWGSGVMLVEIAQPSDLTYRLFDYGRNRPLHIDKGLAAINFESARGNDLVRSLRVRWIPARDNHIESVLVHPDWRLERVTFQAEDQTETETTEVDRFHIITAIDGAVEIVGHASQWKLKLEKGRTTLIPAHAGNYTIRNADFKLNARVLRIFMTLPPERQKVNVGLSMGGTKMALGVVGADGLIGQEPRFHWKEKILASHTAVDAEAVVGLFADEIEKILKKFNVEPERVGSIGIAWPGPGDYEKGIVSATFVEGFNNYPLKEKLEAKLRERFQHGTEVNILLDAYAGLLGEINSEKGGLHGVQNGMALNIATGVAAGLLSEGQVVARDTYEQREDAGRPISVDAGIGQLGRHLIKLPNDEWVYRPTPSGEIDQSFIEESGGVRLTNVAGGPALARRFIAYLLAHKESLRENYLSESLEAVVEGLKQRNETLEHRVLNQITKLAAMRDPLAIDFIIELGTDIGKALRTFVQAYPERKYDERIVVYGGVGENFGKGVAVEGDDNLDLFIRTIQNVSGIKNVVRSTIGVEREFLGFQPRPRSEMRNLDEQIIRDVREKSEEAVRLKSYDANAKTTLKYSFYEIFDRRNDKGGFSLQLNPSRKGRRPREHSGKKLRIAFNPNNFNYNMIEGHELIANIKAAGVKATILSNINPIAEGHFLMVPELSRNLPQYLDHQKYIELALSVLKKSRRNNLKVTYGSIGGCSINHLHFQGFYYGGDQEDFRAWRRGGRLPVENSGRENIFVRKGVTVSRLANYPARALSFRGDGIAAVAHEVIEFVAALNQMDIPYNILFTKKEVIVYPHKYQFPNRFGGGTAALEMSGEYIAFDEETVTANNEQTIWDEIAKTTVTQKEFDESLRIWELHRGRALAERTISWWDDLLGDIPEPSARQFWLKSLAEVKRDLAGADDAQIRIERILREFDPLKTDPSKGIASAYGYAVASFFDPSDSAQLAAIKFLNQKQQEITKQFGSENIVLVPSGYDSVNDKVLNSKGSLHLTLEGLAHDTPAPISTEQLIQTAALLQPVLGQQGSIKGKLIGPFWHKDLAIVMIWIPETEQDPILASRAIVQQTLGKIPTLRPFHVTLAYLKQGKYSGKNFKHEYSRMDEIPIGELPVTLPQFEVNGYKDVAFIDVTRDKKAVINSARSETRVIAQPLTHPYMKKTPNVAYAVLANKKTGKLLVKGTNGRESSWDLPEAARKFSELNAAVVMNSRNEEEVYFNLRNSLDPYEGGDFYKAGEAIPILSDKGSRSVRPILNRKGEVEIYYAWDDGDKDGISTIRAAGNLWDINAFFSLGAPVPLLNRHGEVDVYYSGQPWGDTSVKPWVSNIYQYGKKAPIAIDFEEAGNPTALLNRQGEVEIYFGAKKNGRSGLYQVGKKEALVDGFEFVGSPVAILDNQKQVRVYFLGKKEGLFYLYQLGQEIPLSDGFEAAGISEPLLDSQGTVNIYLRGNKKGQWGVYQMGQEIPLSHGFQNIDFLEPALNDRGEVEVYFFGKMNGQSHIYIAGKEDIVKNLSRDGFEPVSITALFVPPILGHESQKPAQLSGPDAVMQAEEQMIESLAKEVSYSGLPMDEVLKIMREHFRRLKQREKSMNLLESKWQSRLKLAALWLLTERREKKYNYWLSNIFGAGAQKQIEIDRVSDQFAQLMFKVHTEEGISFFIYSGGSGVGKSEIWNSLMRRFPEKFEKFVMYTTRDKRPGEEDGVHYHFKTETQLEELQRNGVTQNFVMRDKPEEKGVLQGVSLDDLKSAMSGAYEQDKIVVFETTPEITTWIKNKYRDKIATFFVSPFFEEDRSAPSGTINRSETRVSNLRTANGEATVNAAIRTYESSMIPQISPLDKEGLGARIRVAMRVTASIVSPLIVSSSAYASEIAPQLFVNTYHFQNTPVIPGIFKTQWPLLNQIISAAAATDRVVIDQRLGVPDAKSVLPLVTFAFYNPKVNIRLALIADKKDVAIFNEKIVAANPNAKLPSNFKIQAFANENEFVSKFQKIYNTSAPLGKSVALVTDREKSIVTAKIGYRKNLLSVIGSLNSLKQTGSTLVVADKLLDGSIWSMGYHFVPVERLGGLEALMVELANFILIQAHVLTSA